MTNVQVETVKTHGVEMDYCRFGQGGRNLVIIPGLSVQSIMPLAEMIADAYGELTEDFTVYVFDRRKELPEGYRIEDAAGEIADAVRELNLGAVDLFGTSQGGMIAMKLTIDHPELVHRLVIGSSAPAIPAVYAGCFEEWRRLAVQGDVEKLYLAFGEKVYTPEVFAQLRQMFINSAKTVTPGELARFVILLDCMKGMDLSEELAGITCPVLVIGSEDDNVLGVEASKQIYHGLKEQPENELYIYNGYGHAAYDCAPDYRTRIHRFLIG